MNGKKFFLNVSKGKFYEKDLPGTPGQFFNEIKGHLVNVCFKTIAEGELMRLHVVDELNFYVLSMLVRGRCAKAFFQMARNLDLLQPMKFKIHAVDGKDYFKIYQNDSAVAWYFIEDNAAILPELPEDRQSFFVNVIKNELIPSLGKKLNPFPNHLIYVRPGTKALQGGYFDQYEGKAKFPKAVGSFERQEKRGGYGKGRIW